MADSKHTPGEWEARPDPNSDCEWEVIKWGRRAMRGDDPWFICTVMDDADADGASSEANARLLAAAPGLLAVAKMMLATDDDWKALSMDERSRVEDAIAKAEGPALSKAST